MGATLEIGDDVLWGKLVKSWAHWKELCRSRRCPVSDTADP